MGHQINKYESRSKALKGNQNARKLAPKADSSLSLRCFSEDKAAWIAAAEKENMSLNQWVVNKLNS